LDPAEYKNDLGARSFLRNKLFVYFHILGSAKQKIRGYIVIISQFDQVYQWYRLKSPFIPGINFLSDSKDCTNTFLSEIIILPQIF